MKRSEINNLLRDAACFLAEMKYLLPPFAFWNAAEWKLNMENPEYREIRENMLGWDITDFGSGNYKKIGLFLFTVRNGNYYNNSYVKPYAEKIMIAGEGQITPYHYHSNKMEDIINRGGGNLLIKLYNSAPDGSLLDTPVTVNTDGRSYKTEAGSVVRLTPGESITLQRGLYHQFWGEEGFGRVLVGEVSMVNDDRTDNHFLNPVGRFPDIEEDEQPLYLLGQDYVL
jgi:D-lyxose ketol-isomerase